MLPGGFDVLAPTLRLRLIEQPEAPVGAVAHAVQQVYIVGSLTPLDLPPHRGELGVGLFKRERLCSTHGFYGGGLRLSPYC